MPKQSKLEEEMQQSDDQESEDLIFDDKKSEEFQTVESDFDGMLAYYKAKVKLD